MALSLEQRVTLLAQGIAADIKTLKTEAGTLSGLSTTAKSNLVAAINEIYTLAAGAGAIADGAALSSTDKTWSINKIDDTLTAAIDALRTELKNGAGAALDTFKELQDAIGNDPTFAATLATQMSKRVRFDAAQVLTVGEQLQACTNLGIGDPDFDFLAAYNTAKA